MVTLSERGWSLANMAKITLEDYLKNKAYMVIESVPRHLLLIEVRMKIF